LGERIASWNRSALVDALAAADVPAAPVNSVGQALVSMGPGWTIRLGGIDLAPSPIRVEGAPPPPRLVPPLLGEHTESVLFEL
jgi:crotonobetainyl-CoA:carnitine CoA-transferase CaiB-like acyl-CoA transferase